MEFNKLQQVKRKFFAYRNGVIADMLRKSGSPFSIIFGLTLPQINEIAAGIGKDRELALQLWNNKSTRCSMLLAPMLLNADDVTLEEALGMCKGAKAPEIADVLCLKLLSRCDFKDDLIKILMTGESLEKYIALRLLLRKVTEVDTLSTEELEFISNQTQRNSDSNLRLLALRILERIEENGC